MHRLMEIPFVHKLIPGIEQVASEYHVGNYVMMRGTGEKFFESMPIYPRCVELPFVAGDATESQAAWACICCSTAVPR